MFLSISLFSDILRQKPEVYFLRGVAFLLEPSLHAKTKISHGFLVYKCFLVIGLFGDICPNCGKILHAYLQSMISLRTTRWL